MFKNANAKVNEFGTVNIKCKIEVSKSKQKLLEQYFGHSRYVYNWAVNYNKTLYKEEGRSLGFVDLAKMLSQLKSDEKTSFLKDVDSTCLQQSLQDYSQSFKMFLQRKSGYPSFRNKHSNQSCRIVNVKSKDNHSIRFDGSNLKLGKFGWVKIKPCQKISDGEIQSATIKRTKTGKVFVTLSIRRNNSPEHLPYTGKETGIDVGVKDFAVFSDGTVISKPEFFEKDDKKLRRLHRQLSRKQKGSKNRQKAVSRLAVVYEKDRNRREDFLNKLSLSIVKDYDVIVTEHLNIQSMLKDKHYKRLHKNISELGWYSFIQKLKYKSEWYGKSFVQTEVKFPSSQICSHCGHKNPDVKNLSVRKWICPECNTHHNRDLNAAINILREGKRIIAVA